MRVSYVLAVKNRVDHVQRFFRNYKKIQAICDELIVIDGDSTDGTKELLLQNKSLIDTFVSEPDNNSAEAFNKGFKLARGKYIRNLMIDDIVAGIDAPVHYMDLNPDIDLLILGGTKQTKYRLAGTAGVPTYTFKDVFTYGACGAGFLIRKSSLDRFGGFDGRSLVNDRELALRYVKNGRVSFFPGNYFLHTYFTESIGIKAIEIWEQQNLELLKKYCPEEYRKEKLKRLLKIKK